MSAVEDAVPPALVVRVLNAVLRLVLRTPLGRMIPSLGLLEFQGRRSGRRYRIPVGVHHVDGSTVVFTPASWRSNFAGERAATLHLRGHAEKMTGRLETDAAMVAALLRTLIDEGTMPAKVGLRVARGHRIDADDVEAVDRAAITLTARDG